MSVTKENFIKLYFSHGDDIEKEDLGEINKWLSEVDERIYIGADVTPDGVTIKFFKS